MQVKERLQAMEARIKKAEARAVDKEQESEKLRRALEQVMPHSMQLQHSYSMQLAPSGGCARARNRAVA